MQMTGEQRIAAPRHKVWEALNDPAVLRLCIPGCQSLEPRGTDGYDAVAEIRIGPIGARFKGAVTLSEIDAPSGCTISGQGNGGIAGTARGAAKVRLSDDGAGTLVSYTVDAEVGGRLAQLGGPVIDATAKQLAGKFFARFGEVVSGTAAPAAVVTPAAAQTATAAAATSTFPMIWFAVAMIALVAGYLLGRSNAADWWLLAVGALAAVAALAGWQTGRRQ